MTDEMLYRHDDFPDHLEYAVDIANGLIPSNDDIMAQCVMSLDEHVEFCDGKGVFTFHPGAAEAAIRFMESLNRTDETAVYVDSDGKPCVHKVVLDPFQKYFVGEIMGWRMTDDWRILRYRVGILEIARNNRKTSLTSMILLYFLHSWMSNQEIVSIATKLDQARILFQYTHDYIQAMDPTTSKDLKVMTHIIRNTERNNSYKSLSSDSKTQDGLTPAIIICDEAGLIHRDLITVLTRGKTARRSPLELYLTTKHPRMQTTLYWEKRSLITNVFRGKTKPEHIRQSHRRRFGLFYGVPLEEDLPAKERHKSDIFNPKNWVMGSPMAGTGIPTVNIEEELDLIEQNPNEESNIRMYTFNQAIKTLEEWVNAGAWDDCRIRDEDMDRTGQGYIGIDCSATDDLMAVDTIFTHHNSEVFVDFHAWTNRKKYRALPKHLKPIYDEARKSGVLTITESDTNDTELVEQYVREQCERYNIRQIRIDRYNATEIYNRMLRDGFPIEIQAQTAGKLNDAVKEVERHIYRGTIKHVGHPFIKWQISNTVANPYVKDGANLTKLQKDIDQPQNKIDNIIAMVMGYVPILEGPEPEVGYTRARVRSW